MTGQCRCCGGELTSVPVVAVDGGDDEQSPICSQCIKRVREAAKCPDCDSSVRVFLIVEPGGGGGFAVDVKHSSTCLHRDSDMPPSPGWSPLFDFLEGTE